MQLSWKLSSQLLKPECLEPVLCNRRSHSNEKLAHCNQRKASTAMKTQHRQKERKIIKKKKKLLGQLPPPGTAM